MRKRWAGLLALLSLAAVSLVVWRWWPQPREALYRFYRDQGKAQTIAGLQDYNVKSNEHFDVYYVNDDADIVDMVLATADRDFELVTKQVGYTPTGRVPLIMYHTRKDMQRAFGWTGNDSAMGVYWKGTIRLLSPHVWIDDEDDARTRQAEFDKVNPIAHEFTHYVVDMYTNGNYPRWFTEGFAQFVEYRITGYLWLESNSSLDQDLYTYKDLDQSYDRLSNQPLAYRESYLMIDYLNTTYGSAHMSQLIETLGSGVPFNVAVERTYGKPVDQLFSDCLRWVHTHADELDQMIDTEW